MIGCLICGFQLAYAAERGDIPHTTQDEAIAVGDGAAMGFGLAYRQMLIGAKYNDVLAHACSRHRALMINVVH